MARKKGSSNQNEFDNISIGKFLLKSLMKKERKSPYFSGGIYAPLDSS